MSQFEEFNKKFKEVFPGEDETSIYNFIDEFDCSKNPLNAELKEDNDDIQYDSYGAEDSKLCKVFYFSEFNIFVQFSGTRESYSGTEWQEMKEVKPTTKTIETYE